MMTRQTILEQINAYLNHHISLEKLVNWAENALIEPDILEDEDAELIMDVLAYLGAADTKGFPLTWEILSGFFERLGGKVRVIVESTP